MAITQVSGMVVYLRAHELGTGYGPPSDLLDDEAIVALDSTPGSAYGFKLRQDASLPAHQQMFELLTAALRNHWRVVLDVDQISGRKNHELLRVVVKA